MTPRASGGRFSWACCSLEQGASVTRRTDMAACVPHTLRYLCPSRNSPLPRSHAVRALWEHALVLDDQVRIPLPTLRSRTGGSCSGQTRGTARSAWHAACEWRTRVDDVGLCTPVLRWRDSIVVTGVESGAQQQYPSHRMSHGWSRSCHGLCRKVYMKACEMLTSSSSTT